MHSSTRRLALRAAAKAALSVTFLGCGGSVLTSSSPDPGVDGATPQLEASVKPEAGSADAGVILADASTPPPPTACGASDFEQDAEVPRATFECCATEVRSVLGSDAAFVPSLPDASAHDPDTLACCHAIILHLDHDPNDAFEADYEAVSGELVACCSAFTPEIIGRACTPWGPSVPPEMPARLVDGPELREVA